MSVVPFRRQDRVVPLEHCWSVSVQPTGRVIDCAIYRSAETLSVRCGYNDARPFLTQSAPTLEKARSVAVRWHRLAMDHAGT